MQEAVVQPSKNESHAEVPRVSVIIPFLNEEKYLAEAVESVLCQTFSDWELILVDDGSTDGSTVIARSYARRCAPKAPKVQYLSHPGHANRGLSASRNVGLKLAKGELVAFLDADDVWHANKLSEQVAIIDAHPELGMVCGAARYWSSWAGGEDKVVLTGHIQNCTIPVPQAALELYPLGKASSPCPSDILMRRSLALEVGGFEEKFNGRRMLYEDQAFLTKIYLVSPVYFSDCVWINYRIHEQSIMGRAAREGCYQEVRTFFLDWLESYITDLPAWHPVANSLRRARMPYKHPWLHRMRTVTKKKSVRGMIRALAAATRITAARCL